MATFRSVVSRQLELFSTLQYRDFRLFWAGLLAQVTGQQMTIVTTGWLAFYLTGSPLMLGYVNLVQGIPQILMTLLGGALADRMDQRRLISISQTATALLLGITAWLTITGRIEIGHLIGLAFLMGLARSFDEPSRQALFPHLLPDRSLISRAVPLISMAWQMNRIVAPSIAGFVIAAAGAGVSFLLAACGAGIMVAVMRLLRLERVPARARGNVFMNIVEGARYAWRNKIFRIVIGAAFVNSLFAQGFILMMPVFAEAVHGMGPVGLGVMYSAAGVGSIVSLFAVYPMIHAVPAGRVIVLSLVGFVGGLIAFALAPWFLLALALLVIVGFFQHLFLSAAQIVLQSLVPDELRGRVMGLLGMLWSIMPLGGALLNAVAEFTGAPYALAGGAGLVLVFVAFVMAPNRSLRSVELPAPESASQQGHR